MRERSRFNYKLIIVILCITIALETLWIISLLRQTKKILPKRVLGKIAIVLDDWGYNLDDLDLLEEIKYPLNISVLPNLAYSQDLAKKIIKKDRELILHLPLEPQSNEYLRLEHDTIMTDMQPPKIREILLKAIKDVPYIKGVSNHMGSKATQDLRTMQVIFKELKKKRLYFLDSQVSPNSVNADLARKMRIKFVKRDVFLDNEERPDYIKGQLMLLRLKALRNGEAVGIGHDRRVTLQVLKEVIPIFAREGFKFVFVSELAKVPK